MRKVFLDELPKKYGKGQHKNKLVIYKKMCEGYIVHFIYDNIKGDIKIKSYNEFNKKFLVKYKNKEFNINADAFFNCHLGNLLGKYTLDFKIEIGTRFQDDKRDIVITDKEYRIRYDKNDRKYNDKYYKYHCNKCGYEDWIEENNIKQGSGCSCCCNPSKKIVLGINTIWDTDKWMIPYIGEECAKTHTHGCNDEIYPICPDCGRKKSKKMKINAIYRTHKMGCVCGDSTSYPEKIVFNIFSQINLNFEYHKYFEWAKNIKTNNSKLCGRKEYDFYFEFNGEQYLCEIHGEQHYINKGWKTSKSLKEEKENDKLKKELAIKNGIKENNYIVIDCRYSNLQWIRDNKDGILNSRLNKLFDLSKIDWNKCEEFALSNRVKEACNLWESGIHKTCEIGNIMKITQQIVIKYLKQGNKLNWCNYNTKEPNIKEIILFDNIHNKFYLFKSPTHISKQSIELFGIKLSANSLSRTCRNKQNNCKGFTCKYIEDLSQEEYIKYDIKNKLKELWDGTLILRYKKELKNYDKNINKVICITTSKIFNSKSEAGNFYKIKSYSHISNCCNGERNYCGKLPNGIKLQWKYISDLTQEECIKYDIENKLKELYNIELVQAS